MREFKSYNPYVILIHFTFVVGVCMLVMHPAVLAVALFSAMAYSVVLIGLNRTLKSLVAVIPLVLITACLNPLFNHSGNTILTYFPTGKPVTLEAVVYGLASGTMLLAVILWFSCFNTIFKGDKVQYVFGGVAPSLALVMTMSLAFVPKLIKKTNEIIMAQRTMGKDLEKGKLKQRVILASSILSALVSWSLESSVETAQSMRARGYGRGKRTNYSVYSFDRYDTAFSGIIGAVIIMFFLFLPEMEFTYYPTIEVKGIMPGALFYAMVCFAPMVIDLMEVKRWS